MHEHFIMNLANGFMGTAVLYTACELKIFDILADSAKNTKQLANEIDIDEGLLEKILRPLVVYNLLLLNKHGEFALTKSGNYLLSSREDSLWSYVIFTGRESTKLWDQLYPSLLQGRSPAELIDREHIFTTREANKEKGKIFDGMMRFVSSSLDISGFLKKFGNKDANYTFIDVGGGTGAVLLKFLAYFKNSYGIIFDLDPVKEDALHYISSQGYIDQCTFTSGDFFEQIPSTGNIYLLSRVLHDWNDADAMRILTNVYECMPAQAKLVVLENVIPEVPTRSALEAYMNDLQMWAFFGSNERTQTAFTRLFASVNFEVESMIPIKEASSVNAFILRKNEMELGTI